MSQLSIPAKKPRFGPKAATSAYWIDIIDRNPIYQQPKDHSTDLTNSISPAIFDYFDLAGQRNYPPKAPEFEPYWFKPIGGLKYTNFKIWAWLEATQALELPISQESEDWFNQVNTYQLKRESVELLNKFFRPESKKPLSLEHLDIHDSVPANTALIKHIEFDTPDGSRYCTQLSTLNNTLKDTRSIPITKSGERIHSKYIRHYLEERLAEYLALGGLVEIIHRSSLDVGNYELPDPFYWDLWSNLNHLRFAYLEYQDQEHFDPKEEEDPLYNW